MEGVFEPKLGLYKTSKTLRIKKRTSNYNPNCHIEDYIM
jgi:hypothetical protein